MVTNYLKIAWRNLVKYKGYTFINLSGLAVGMACCILIYLWIRDEYNIDKFNNCILYSKNNITMEGSMWFHPLLVCWRMN